MSTSKKKKELAEFWEQQKAQGTLRQALGEPTQRGRGRPPVDHPLRRVTLRLEDRTLSQIRRVARENGVPWQRMVRAWITQRLPAEMYRLASFESGRSEILTVKESSFSYMREVPQKVQEAQRFRRATSGNLGRLLTSVPAA